jgi:hypothetical protein
VDLSILERLGDGEGGDWRRRGGNDPGAGVEEVEPPSAARRINVPVVAAEIDETVDAGARRIMPSRGRSSSARRGEGMEGAGVVTEEDETARDGG